MRTSAGLLFLFILFFYQSPAQPVLPLSKLHIQAGAVFPFHISKPYSFYKRPAMAPRVQIGANIGRGELYLAAASSYFNSDSFPLFTSSVLTLGYAHNISIYKKTWLKPGLAFGNNYMQFHRIRTNTAHRNESELLLEASLSLQTALYKKLHLIAGVSFQRTLLHHRFDVMNSNIALVYYLDTPKFIKNLID